MTSASPADDSVRDLRELVATGRFREALELHRRTAGDAGVRPDVQLLAATAATRLGDLGLGVRLAAEALERFRARADLDGRMRTLNLLGAIAFERGELETAQQAFDETLRLAQQLGDSLLAARANNNLASVAQLHGRPDRSIGLYRGALLAYLRLGDRRGAVETYHNLGLSYRQAGELHEAEAMASLAVRHAEMLGDPSLLALAVMGRAEINLELQELDLAAEELRRAARLAREAGDELGTAEGERLSALLALRRGRYDEARAAAEHGRDIAERYGSALLAAECTAAAALAWRALGDAARAETHRAAAREGLARLDAAKLLERFDAEWERTG